jgi:PAS domain S-box-containing protein
MKDSNKTKAQLIKEPTDLRKQIPKMIESKVGIEEQSEERFRLLFDNVFDAIVPVDEDGNIVDVNRAACKMLGYSKEELLKLNADDIHPPEALELMRTAVRRLFQNRIDYAGEIPLLRKDGQIVFAEAGAVAITIDGKNYCLGSFRDITERKKAEEALKISEDKFKTLNNNLNVGVFRNTIGTKGRFIEVNPAFLKMFGYAKKEDLFDMNVSNLYENPKKRKKFNKKMLQEGSVTNEENTFKRKDGTTFIGSVSAVAVKGKEGEVSHYDGIVEDITERKESERALKKAFIEIRELKNRLHTENIYLREEIRRDHNFENIIGESDALKYVLFKIKQVATTDTSVLILGETGSGKELAARAIHNASRLKGRPLVKVNCATLPSNLIESELFGHEKGAFTGAQKKMVGRFELANGATIFLDEIGELPLDLQNKLLRVLEEGAFERLGSSRTIKVEVRVIAATNRDVKEEIRRGRFRKDLYYRLNVFPISMPPLRQRKEDIPLLVNAFVHKLNKRMGKNVERIPKRAMKTLQNYSWPGNVRELENVIERAIINSQDSMLRLVDKLEPPLTDSFDGVERKTLMELERDYMVKILEETYWRIEGKNGAAAILGLNPSTLRARIRKLEINRPQALSRK